jgi:hypothetical protein
MNEIVLSYTIQAMPREKGKREKAIRYTEESNMPNEKEKKIAQHNWDRNIARNTMKQ